MEKVHENRDKIFYRLPDNFADGEFLGELAVQGFNHGDVEVFSKIYAKAKEIGANSFTLSVIQNVDGTLQKFDPWNYRLNLFYTPIDRIPAENNVVIVFGSPDDETKVVINRRKIDLPPRSYFIQPLARGEQYRIGTGKLFGSTLITSGKENQRIQYLQIGGAQLRGEGGFVSFKSGDVVHLERSYADFLTVVYQLITP